MVMVMRLEVGLVLGLASGKGLKRGTAIDTASTTLARLRCFR